jgi:nitrogen fixation/metabolism regulation signal transduction histidine kinase
MRLLGTMKSSIHRRYVSILTFTIVATGLVACVIAFQLLRKAAELANDEKVVQSLSDSMDSLLQVRRERRALAENLAQFCSIVAENPNCADSGMRLSPDASNRCGKGASWIDENDLCIVRGSTTFIASFSWANLKQPYEANRDALEIREHLDLVQPQLQRAFILVFGGSLAVFILLGIGASLFLARSTSHKIQALVSYTRRIGRGEFSPPPNEIKGPDEIGILACAMDSMVKDLQQTRERLVLTERLSSWQEAARRVAHELKNPLTPIQLVGDEIKSAAKSAPESMRGILERCSRIILDEVESLLRMVKEFVAFGRLPQPEAVLGDITEVINDFETRLCNDDSVQLTVEHTDRSLKAFLDRRMIMQILDNLLINSKNASDRIPIAIAIRTSSRDQKGCIEFTDNGPGVPESIRPKIFEPYVTSSPRSDKPGSGLGLAIARKIAMDHGGDIVLLETSGTGTTFRLTLPLAEPLGSEEN